MGSIDADKEGRPRASIHYQARASRQHQRPDPARDHCHHFRSHQRRENQDCQTPDSALILRDGSELLAYP